MFKMWKDCSCKINFICIYPGVGIRSQPKSSIINPLPGKKKKKKVSICIQGFSCLPGFFLLFPSTCWFLTAVLILSVAGLFADSVSTKVYPPSFPPPLLSSLSYFVLLFLLYEVQHPGKYFYQHIGNLLLQQVLHPGIL